MPPAHRWVPNHDASFPTTRRAAALRSQHSATSTVRFVACLPRSTVDQCRLISSLPKLLVERGLGRWARNRNDDAFVSGRRDDFAVVIRDDDLPIERKVLGIIAPSDETRDDLSHFVEPL